MAPEELTQILPHVDPDRRQFILRMLAGAWATPLVASFTLGGLLAEQALGQGSNLCAANIGPLVDVQKTVSAAEVTAGNNLTYTITVHNCTGSLAPTVSLVDPLPAGTTFVSASKLSGDPAWSLVTPPVGSGGTVQASIANLLGGDSAVFQIVVYVVPY
jgi:uncharacterized repeat protein (TIGR01451 family)